MKPFLLVLVLGVLGSCAYKHKDADIVIHNARIYMCNPDFEIEEAMAIKDGEIVEIGPERQIMNKYVGDVVIDNKTRPVYPLFIDEQDMLEAFMDAREELGTAGVSDQDILLGLTIWAARENYIDENEGSLQEGKAANFFITDRDLLKTPTEDLTSVSIEALYREGKLE